MPTKLIIAIVGCLLYATPAHAQASSTWVSGVGNDANPCSRTQPCKSFAIAIAKTNPGGEIHCLDRGSFGAVTITKSVSILCGGSAGASVLTPFTNGIAINAGPNDRIVLEGIELDGQGTGLRGVSWIAGGLLFINKCKIHDFATNGIETNIANTNGRALITKSEILFNGTNGTSNSGGVTVQGSGVTVIMVDAVIEGNRNYGVEVSGSSNRASFIRTLVDPTGIVSIGSGILESIGTSNVFQVGTPTIAPGFQ